MKKYLQLQTWLDKKSWWIFLVVFIHHHLDKNQSIDYLLSHSSKSKFAATLSWSIMRQIYRIFLFLASVKHETSTQSAKLKDHVNLKSSSQTQDNGQATMARAPKNLDQSLTVLEDNLWCQACCQTASTRDGNCDESLKQPVRKKISG